MRLFIPCCLAFALLAGRPASAEEILRWVDEEGEVHYTNDSSAVPARSRAGAQPTRGAELGRVSGGARAQPEPAVGEAEGDPAVRPAPSEELDRRAAEREWRAAFRAAHERIAELEATTAADRRRVEDPGAAGMALHFGPHGEVLPSPEFQQTKERLEANERELGRAREQLHDLEIEAAQKAIPTEWRR